MSKRDPRVNYYRSSKKPGQQVIVADLDKEIGGGKLVGIIDGKSFHKVIVGQDLTESESGSSVESA